MKNSAQLIVQLHSACALTFAAFSLAPASAQPASPEIHSDGRVTFLVSAPKAKAVAVRGDWTQERIPMATNEGGIWNVTVGPLKAEIYRYNFNIDGFRSLDLNNPVVDPEQSLRSSLLEVPGNPQLLHEFQRVPHGSVITVHYHSESLGKRRAMYVYTPPGYRRIKGERYPVL